MTVRNLDSRSTRASVAVVRRQRAAGHAGAMLLEHLLRGRLRGAGLAGQPAAAGGVRAAIGGERGGSAGGRRIWRWSRRRRTRCPAVDRRARGARLPGGGGAEPTVPAAGGLRQAMLDAARPHLLRVIGPGTLGVARAGARAEREPRAGRRRRRAGSRWCRSPARSPTALIDWAADHGIGFSQVVSLGDDGRRRRRRLPRPARRRRRGRGRSCSISRACRSRASSCRAARAAARVKPVIAVKAGRTPAGGRGGARPIPARWPAPMRWSRRRCAGPASCGCGASPSSSRPPRRVGALPADARGPGSAIVTNGGGAGVLARRPADRGRRGARGAGARDAGAARRGAAGRLEPGNPVDLGGDAPPDALRARRSTALAADPGVDALLAMHCPSGARPTPVAAAAGGGGAGRGAAGSRGKPVLACWMGGATARGGAGGAARAGRRELRHAGGGGRGGRPPDATGAGRRRRCCRCPTARRGGLRRRRRRTRGARVAAIFGGGGRRGPADADRAGGEGGARRLRHRRCRSSASRGRRRRRRAPMAAAMLGGRRAAWRSSCCRATWRTSRTSAAWCSTWPRRRGGGGGGAGHRGAAARRRAGGRRSTASRCSRWCGGRRRRS